MTVQSKDLADLLRVLRETPSPTGRVLSVYIAAGPSRAVADDIMLSLRDGCRALRASLPEEEQKAFEAAVAQAERYLTSEFVPGQPGQAIFASGSTEYFFATPLPTSPIDEVEWQERPHIGHLQAVIDDFERTAVVLFDKERARICTVYLGELESQIAIHDDVPGKQATGGWYALSQSRFARHHEDHVRRHAKRAVADLMSVLRDRPFERLFVAGPDEAIAVLRAHLPRPLQSRLEGTLDLELFAGDKEVLTAALAASEDAERRHELSAVRELLDHVSTPHVEVGVEATLSALGDGRVDKLFVSETLTTEGGECPDCGRLAGFVGKCPFCAATLRPVKLLDAAVLLALGQGARIEMVGGEADRLLSEHGGMGAQTRYARV